MRIWRSWQECRASIRRWREGELVGRVSRMRMGLGLGVGIHGAEFFSSKIWTTPSFTVCSPPGDRQDSQAQAQAQARATTTVRKASSASMQLGRITEAAKDRRAFETKALDEVQKMRSGSGGGKGERTGRDRSRALLAWSLLHFIPGESCAA